MKEYTIERLKKCMPLTEGNYEDIDKDMIPILTELNEKGYKTMFCCQGHVEDCTYITYLTFYRKHIFSEPIPVFEVTNSRTNSKNKHTKIGKSNFGGITYHWFGRICKTDKEAEIERKQLIKELMEWAKRLEPIENNLIKKYYLWGVNNGNSKKLGEMISEEERERIKNKNEYKEYKEVFVITDGDKWKEKYRVIA